MGYIITTENIKSRGEKKIKWSFMRILFQKFYIIKLPDINYMSILGNVGGVKVLVEGQIVLSIHICIIYSLTILLNGHKKRADNGSFFKFFLTSNCFF